MPIHSKMLITYLLRGRYAKQEVMVVNQRFMFVHKLYISTNRNVTTKRVCVVLSLTRRLGIVMEGFLAEVALEMGAEAYVGVH